MTKPLLSLDTLVIRPVIEIDGKNYDIIAPDELPILTSHALAAKGRKLDVLMKSEALGESGQAELKELVRSISDTIMDPVPARIRNKLSEAQRINVIEAFTALLLSKKTGTAAAIFGSLVPSLIGASSFLASNGSTAPPPPIGSPKHPSRS